MKPIDANCGNFGVDACGGCGLPAFLKPARDLKLGDEFEITLGDDCYIIVVMGLTATYCTENEGTPTNSALNQGSIL